MVVHSALSTALTAEADDVLRFAGLAHTPHEIADPVVAAVAAAEDPEAVALLGPSRSADVNEALAATAPAGLPLIAPVATWAAGGSRVAA